MGPAARAAISNHVAATSDKDELSAAMLAFPSPASISDSLDTPSPFGQLATCLHSQSSTSTRRTSFWDANYALPPDPRDVSILQPISPLSEAPPETSMNLIVGGTLAPGNSPASTRPLQRRGAGLRLPSFQQLGIGAPHPDRYAQIDLDGPFTTASRESMSVPFSVKHDMRGHMLEFLRTTNMTPGIGGGATPSPGNGRATQNQLSQVIHTLTPPAEGREMDWHVPTATLPLMGSSAAEPGAILGASADTPRTSSAPLPTLNLPLRIEGGGSGASGDSQSWVDGATQALVESLRTAPHPNNPLRVLSHALPSPSQTGHIFPTIINAIHGTTPASPTVWINVFHAIPGRFNLADLPTSPPATPGPALFGDDYFTQKVFDSAVPISDYQEDLSALPRSPRPVVPPSSINVSVVERYIPPSSPNEFADMFNPNGPSVLVDRLVELSPSNGTLVFIYPTRTGAQTFMNEYLGPVLDPLLRSMCVVHGLSSDLSRQLGSMCAVDRLLEHTELARSIDHLCATLTQRSTSMHRFHGRRAKFSVAHAAQQQVVLDREVWAKDWWTKQEKPRVKDVVTRYAHEAQKKSSNGHDDRPATPAELIQTLLEGVVKKPYPDGQSPRKGVEVGVFVIQRSG